MDDRGVERRTPDPGALVQLPPGTESPALRDAAEIVRRAADDEAAATDARARFRAMGPPRLEPDARIAALLARDETLIAVRASAILERREPRPSEPTGSGVGGQLAVTSQRLILAGRHLLTFDLAEVEEIAMSGDRLLVVMRDGLGVTLSVEQPRLLRVEIAAARAASRTAVLGEP